MLAPGRARGLPHGVRAARVVPPHPALRSRAGADLRQPGRGTGGVLAAGPQLARGQARVAARRLTGVPAPLPGGRPNRQQRLLRPSQRVRKRERLLGSRALPCVALPPGVGARGTSDADPRVHAAGPCGGNLAAADVSLDASDITTIESLAAQAVGARGDESYMSIAIFSAGLRGDGAAGLKAKAHQVDQ